MLRACRHALRRDGRIAFATIVVAEGLSKPAHRRAARMGPRAVTSTRPIGTLMEAAGFENIEIADVSTRFMETARAWVNAFEAREVELRNAMRGEYEERQRGRKEMILGTEEGLLKRVLVSASAPSS